MLNQIKPPAVQIKFFPGLGFAPVIAQPTTTATAQMTAQVVVTSTKK